MKCWHTIKTRKDKLTTEERKELRKAIEEAMAEKAKKNAVGVKEEDEE